MDEIKEVQEFLHHVTESVYDEENGLLAVMDNNDGHYSERFELKIELNGKSISLDLHADLFNRLTTFLEETIEELEL